MGYIVWMDDKMDKPSTGARILAVLTQIRWIWNRVLNFLGL